MAAVCNRNTLMRTKNRTHSERANRCALVGLCVCAGAPENIRMTFIRARGVRLVRKCMRDCVWVVMLGIGVFDVSLGSRTARCASNEEQLPPVQCASSAFFMRPGMAHFAIIRQHVCVICDFALCSHSLNSQSHGGFRRVLIPALVEHDELEADY